MISVGLGSTRRYACRAPGGLDPQRPARRRGVDKVAQPARVLDGARREADPIFLNAEVDPIAVLAEADDGRGPACWAAL